MGSEMCIRDRGDAIGAYTTAVCGGCRPVRLRDHEMAFTPIALATAGLTQAAGPEITSSGFVRISYSALISFTLGIATSDCRPCRAGRVCVLARETAQIQCNFPSRHCQRVATGALHSTTPQPRMRSIYTTLPTRPASHKARIPHIAGGGRDSDAFAVGLPLPPSARAHRRQMRPSRDAAAANLTNTHPQRSLRPTRDAEGQLQVPPAQRAGT